MKNLFTLLMATILVIFLAACGGESNEGIDSNQSTNDSQDAGTEKDDTVYKLSMTATITENSSYGYAMKKWAEEIEELSEGRLKVDQMTWSGAVLKADNNLEGLGNRIVDVAFVSNSNHPTKTPLSNALNPAFLNNFNGAAEVQKELYETVPELKEEWESHNVVPVGWFNGTDQILMTNYTFDPSKVDNYVGNRKIFAVGGAAPYMVKNLGGIPVALGSSEVYSAVQKGTLDGVSVFAAHSLSSMSLFEVIKQATDIRVGGVSMWVGLAFNKDAYDELPEDLKEVIKQAEPILAAAHAEEHERLVFEGFKKSEDANVELVQLTAEQATALRKKINPEGIWEEGIVAAEQAGHTNARELFEKTKELLEAKQLEGENSKTVLEKFLESKK